MINNTVNFDKQSPILSRFQNSDENVSFSSFFNAATTTSNSSEVRSSLPRSDKNLTVTLLVGLVVPLFNRLLACSNIQMSSVPAHFSNNSMIVLILSSGKTSLVGAFVGAFLRGFLECFFGDPSVLLDDDDEEEDDDFLF